MATLRDIWLKLCKSFIPLKLCSDSKPSVKWEKLKIIYKQNIAMSLKCMVKFPDKLCETQCKSDVGSFIPLVAST